MKLIEAADTKRVFLDAVKEFRVENRKSTPRGDDTSSNSGY